MPRRQGILAGFGEKDSADFECDTRPNPSQDWGGRQKQVDTEKETVDGRVHETDNGKEQDVLIPPSANCCRMRQLAQVPSQDVVSTTKQINRQAGVSVLLTRLCRKALSTQVRCS